MSALRPTRGAYAFYAARLISVCCYFAVLLSGLVLLKVGRTAARQAGGKRLNVVDRDLSDNHAPSHSPFPMTVNDSVNPPQGFAQLTEGLIRTTDLVLGKTSTSWCEPHCFVVGRDVGAEGMRVARRIGPAPRARGRN